MSDPRVLHICKNCGHMVSRGQMKTGEIISGVVQCPACEDAGPLNVEVVEVDDRKPPSSVRQP